MNLLTQINQLEHLTSNEKSLCDYIRNHPMECLSKTPQQLAGDLYLSTSTVYRLLKKLDLKGYSDFKVALWTVCIRNRKARCRTSIFLLRQRQHRTKYCSI